VACLFLSLLKGYTSTSHLGYFISWDPFLPRMRVVCEFFLIELDFLSSMAAARIWTAVGFLIVAGVYFKLIDLVLSPVILCKEGCSLLFIDADSWADM